MNINDVALRRLGSRNRTVEELRQYLIEKGFHAKETQKLLDEFIDYGYLNDSKYCEQYFNYAFGKGRAKKRVFTELKQKGVAEEVINQAYSEYDIEIDERAAAWQETLKILRLADLNIEDIIPNKVMGRIGRRLSSYGYSSSTIYGILEELRNEQNREN